MADAFRFVVFIALLSFLMWLVPWLIGKMAATVVLSYLAEMGLDRSYGSGIIGEEKMPQFFISMKYDKFSEYANYVVRATSIDRHGVHGFYKLDGDNQEWHSIGLFAWDKMIKMCPIIKNV